MSSLDFNPMEYLMDAFPEQFEEDVRPFDMAPPPSNNMNAYDFNTWQSPDGPSTFGLLDLDPALENEAHLRITANVDQSLDELLANPACQLEPNDVAQPLGGEMALDQSPDELPANPAYQVEPYHVPQPLRSEMQLDQSPDELLANPEYQFGPNHFAQLHQSEMALDQAQPDSRSVHSPSGPDDPLSDHGLPAGAPVPELSDQLPQPAVEAPPVLDARAIIPPKLGTRFSAEVKAILDDWIAAHRDHPFADKEEAEELARRTRLSIKQVNDYLANYRRRHRDGSQDGSTSSNSSTGARVPGGRRPRTEVGSGSEGEPSTATQGNAMASGSFDPNSSNGVPHGPVPMASQQPVVSATEGMGRGQSRDQTLPSRQSRDSLPTPQSHRPPRTNHAAAAARRSPRTTRAEVPKKFECTFCSESFDKMNRWKRHEATTHMFVDSWSCARNGPVVYDAARRPSCVFCKAPSPDHAHFETHGFSRCQSRPVKERTFGREDHMKSHLHSVHKVNADQLGCHLGQWKTTMEIQSRCGFCDRRMNSWKAREHHLADHFKAGCTMSNWKGDWGFDQSVLSRLKKATCPTKLSPRSSS